MILDPGAGPFPGCSSKKEMTHESATKDRQAKVYAKYGFFLDPWQHCYPDEKQLQENV
jgi:hypothetical protein